MSATSTIADTTFAPSRRKNSAGFQIAYSREALRQDLARVRKAWDECQAKRDRDAIYCYLTAVFDLVAWWAAEDRATSRARWALRLNRTRFHEDPLFVAQARAARSKWSGRSEETPVIPAVRQAPTLERRSHALRGRIERPY